MKTLTDAQVDRAKLAYSKRATQGGEASFEDCIRAALATLTDNPPRPADAGKETPEIIPGVNDALAGLTIRAKEV